MSKQFEESKKKAISVAVFFSVGWILIKVLKGEVENLDGVMVGVLMGVIIGLIVYFREVKRK